MSNFTYNISHFTEILQVSFNTEATNEPMLIAKSMVNGKWSMANSSKGAK